jgi:2-polyprenyl-3-methyl-5-hydroxy-6-metoxy-1,4-benzoquinol methylase
MKINNAIYERLGREWWNDDAGFEISSLRYCINPLRFTFFRKHLEQTILPGKTVLDIGCGGGFLSITHLAKWRRCMGIEPT